MPRRIEPGWRYTLAQLILRALFGRKWHFISPWYMVGVGAAAGFVSPDGKRVLIQQRAGQLEGTGKWGTFGGYLEPQHQESFAQGLTRELWEESGLTINPKNFDTKPDWVTILHRQVKNELWEHSGIGVWFFRTVPADMISHLELSSEVSAYKWVTREELDAMWERGEISGVYEDHYTGLRLALEAAAKGLPPLDLTPPSA